MLRTGKEHLESLRDGRVVYVGGERIDDVTRHPWFREAAKTVAGLYDLKDAFNARFKDLALPKGARQGPPNRELEAIGRLTRGR